MEPNDTLLIDLGCSNLCFSKEYKQKHPQVDVMAFDPNPRFINCYNFAVSSSSGLVDYCLTNDYRANNILNAVIDSKPIVSKQSVFCVDIGTIILMSSVKYKKIVIKIDVEGSEFDILEHLIKTTIIKFVSEIHVEWHDRINPAVYKDRKTKILSDLKPYNVVVHHHK